MTWCSAAAHWSTDQTQEYVDSFAVFLFSLSYTHTLARTCTHARTHDRQHTSTPVPCVLLSFCTCTVVSLSLALALAMPSYAAFLTEPPRPSQLRLTQPIMFGFLIHTCPLYHSSTLLAMLAYLCISFSFSIHTRTHWSLFLFCYSSVLSLCLHRPLVSSSALRRAWSCRSSEKPRRTRRVRSRSRQSMAPTEADTTALLQHCRSVV